MPPVHDLRIRGFLPLTPPRQLRDELPLSPEGTRTVVAARETVQRILRGEDRRLLAVVGPCSIHDERAGLEYARRLRELAISVQERLFVVMRVYFEKPRTTTGWKGLINDPHLDGTFDVLGGLRLARRLLLEIVGMGVPAGTEMLEPITPQYIADLISWSSVGARTTESPTHRQMASGLSMPVGFKNATDGSLDPAINALLAAREPHNFLGIDADGRTCVVQSTGNEDGHLILRGGHAGPNYSAEHVAAAIAQLEKKQLPQRVLIDCSHANSNKDYRLQSEVWRSVLGQRLEGNAAILGMMLESNLEPGQQKLDERDPRALRFGVSITDGCIGWDETESLVRSAFEALSPVAV